jgi:NAD(P)-dependent dehydrogenase (short-subunit alcohol dehydrogenase family)
MLDGVGGWTAADIPDQAGRTAVVTGANSGLGLVTARELARAGARVILACRNVERGEEAASRIRDESPRVDAEVARLDLADLSSVREFATAFARRHDGLDLLVNNAGVMAVPRRLTADGFEMHIGTNHLGHFALTGLLLERLLARPEPRVVTVSSGAHRSARIAFDNLQGERRYFRWAAYGQSKLANLLFAYELQRRAEAARLPLRSAAAHPGWAATNLQFAGMGMDGPITRRIESLASKAANVVFAQSDEMGALPILYAATAADLPGGSYVGPDGPFELHGHPKLVSSSAASRNPESAHRLWEVSEELTAVRYGLTEVTA